MSEFNPYLYHAKVLSIYDGDTITVEVDLGFDIKTKMKLRLAHINTPEIRGDEREEGLKSRDYLRSLITDKEIIIETKKDKTGKYGRMLAILHFEGMNINEHLITEGYAERYM